MGHANHVQRLNLSFVCYKRRAWKSMSVITWNLSRQAWKIGIGRCTFGWEKDYKAPYTEKTILCPHLSNNCCPSPVILQRNKRKQKVIVMKWRTNIKFKLGIRRWPAKAESIFHYSICQLSHIHGYVMWKPSTEIVNDDLQLIGEKNSRSINKIFFLWMRILKMKDLWSLRTKNGKFFNHHSTIYVILWVRRVD